MDDTADIVMRPKFDLDKITIFDGDTCGYDDLMFGLRFKEKFIDTEN
jgi:hypothetical protein